MSADLFYRIVGISDPVNGTTDGNNQSDPESNTYKVPIYKLIAGLRRVQETSWTRFDLEQAFDIAANDPDLDAMIANYNSSTNKGNYLLGLLVGFAAAESDHEGLIGLQDKANFNAFISTFV